MCVNFLLQQIAESFMAVLKKNFVKFGFAIVDICYCVF